MAKVRKGKQHGAIDGDFVVFLIGMRFNKAWKVHKWFPVFVAMPRMLRRLMQHPELGLLHYRILLDGKGITVVQYWRSVAQLEHFARSPEEPHRRAWQQFYRAIGDSGDVGVWHETHPVAAGTYDALYSNMPVFGLAAAAAAAERTPAAEPAAA